MTVGDLYDEKRSNGYKPDPETLARIQRRKTMTSPVQLWWTTCCTFPTWANDSALASDASGPGASSGTGAVGSGTNG